MSISCPPGMTFLDGELNYENSIKAECGPRQYRSKVVSIFCSDRSSISHNVRSFGPNLSEALNLYLLVMINVHDIIMT